MKPLSYIFVIKFIAQSNTFTISKICVYDCTSIMIRNKTKRDYYTVYLLKQRFINQTMLHLYLSISILL